MNIKNSLRTEIHTNEIPLLFDRFKKNVGEQNWLKISKKIKSEIRGNKFLAETLVTDYATTLELAELSKICDKFGRLPNDLNILRDFYKTLGFLAQTLSLIENSSAKDKKQLLGRIRGSFRNPDDSRALQVELLAATHFIHRGFTISWPEREKGRHDLEIHDIGKTGLQVECKSVSQDKGRKIHRREALEFFDLIYKDAKRLLRTLNTGLYIVISIPDRLPKNYTERQKLAKLCLKQIQIGKSEKVEGIDFRVGEYSIDQIAELNEDKSLQFNKQAIENITLTKNRESMIIGNNSGGGFIFVIQSLRPDTLLESIFESLEQSAKNQVDTKRPVLFFVSLHDLESGQLKAIAEDQDSHPNQLQIHASNFLAKSSLDHVIGVHFTDRGVLEPRIDGVQGHQGTTYSFPKKVSAMWNADFDEIFK